MDLRVPFGSEIPLLTILPNLPPASLIFPPYLELIAAPSKPPTAQPITIPTGPPMLPIVAPTLAPAPTAAKSVTVPAKNLPDFSPSPMRQLRMLHTRRGLLELLREFRW